MCEPRDIDAPGAMAEVTAHALLAWVQRENGFPAFTRMKWHQATWEARAEAMLQSARALGYLQ